VNARAVLTFLTVTAPVDERVEALTLEIVFEVPSKIPLANVSDRTVEDVSSEKASASESVPPVLSIVTEAQKAFPFEVIVWFEPPEKVNVPLAELEVTVMPVEKVKSP
jgi:hypothetical protein